MPRAAKKYHYIYKTTCLVNQKFYIGMHSTNDITDGYIGSGKRLWYSINKYSREKHSFEILEYLPDRKSLASREKEIVNKELLKDPLCMNLVIGGEGEINYSLIGEKNTTSQKGERNSQFGKCWIHHLDLKQSKSIKKEQLDQYLTEGWIKGRLKEIKLKPLIEKIHKPRGRKKKEISIEKLNEVIEHKKNNLTLKEISSLTGLNYHNVRNIILNNETFTLNNLMLYSRNNITVIDIYGNIFQVSNKDPRFLSGELVSLHNNKNKFVAKDKDGNRFQIDKNDPRFLSGNLVHHSKKK